jgi:hypothetical protein
MSAKKKEVLGERTMDIPKGRAKENLGEVLVNKLMEKACYIGDCSSK